MPSRSLLVAALVLAGCDSSEMETAAQGTGGGVPFVPDPPAAGLGEWTCEAGELELEDGSCLPAGIPPEECGVGFEPTADRACTPVLPTAPCMDGEMALPGEATCRPVAPCPNGTWGDIPVETSTEFVDGAYPNTDSDGSATKPWTNVQAAIDAAVDGAIVAVAQGTYNQALIIQGKRVRLWGRCPALVRILSSGEPALRIEAGADGSEVRDIAFEAPDDIALHVGRSIDVILDRIWIQRAGLIGFDIEDGNPGATITRSLVEDSSYIGIFGYGSPLTVEDTEIRGMSQTSTGSFGTGIRVFDDGVPTELLVRHSVIAGAFGAGIYVYESNAVIEDTVVTDVEPQAGDPDDGYGIYASSDIEGASGSLEVSGSYIERVHAAGISLRNSGNVRTTVVRDVIAPTDSASSFGIVMLVQDGGTPPTLGVRSVVVERTRVMGIAAAGSIARVEAAIVRDTEPTEGGLQPGSLEVGGRGIGVEVGPMMPHAEMTVAGCRVERTHELGILALGADLTIESTLVSDVAGRTTDGFYGRGVAYQLGLETGIPATGVIRNSLIERAHEHGIIVLDSHATIESTWIRETEPSGPGLTVVGRYAMGRGIGVQGHTVSDEQSSATIDRSLIEGSDDAGVIVAGSDVTFSRSVVRDTIGSLNDLYGDGILAFAMPDDIYDPQPAEWFPSSIEVIDSIVEDSVRAGISNFWSTVAVGGSWLSCNAIDLNGEDFEDQVFDFHDLGGNTCLCGGELRECKTTTSGLAAPVASDK